MSEANTREIEDMARRGGFSSNPTALSAFHVSIDPDTESGDKLGSSGAGTMKDMARLTGFQRCGPGQDSTLSDEPLRLIA